MIYKRLSFVGFIISVSRSFNTAKHQNLNNFKLFYVQKNSFSFFYPVLKKAAITTSNHKNMWTKDVSK